MTTQPDPNIAAVLIYIATKNFNAALDHIIQLRSEVVDGSTTLLLGILPTLLVSETALFAYRLGHDSPHPKKAVDLGYGQLDLDATAALTKLQRTHSTSSIGYSSVYVILESIKRFALLRQKLVYILLTLLDDIASNPHRLFGLIEEITEKLYNEESLKPLGNLGEIIGVELFIFKHLIQASMAVQDHIFQNAAVHLHLGHSLLGKYGSLVRHTIIASTLSNGRRVHFPDDVEPEYLLPISDPLNVSLIYIPKEGTSSCDGFSFQGASRNLGAPSGIHSFLRIMSYPKSYSKFFTQTIHGPSVPSRHSLILFDFIRKLLQPEPSSKRRSSGSSDESPHDQYLDVGSSITFYDRNIHFTYFVCRLDAQVVLSVIHSGDGSGWNDLMKLLATRLLAVHGQKKVAMTADAQAQRAIREHGKILAYQELCHLVTDLRSRNELTDASLQATTSLLTQNPEFYTIWNFRREILSHMHKDMLHSEHDKIQQSCETELKLADELLQGAPKSYWVWNHRRWVLEHMPNPTWDHELKLLGYMLDLDPRNFHGWDYRRYVVAAIKTRLPKEEFAYTLDKIGQNFSNYSAWHYRSKLLPNIFLILILVMTPYRKCCVCVLDLELVRNAILPNPWINQHGCINGGFSGKVIYSFSVPNASSSGTSLLAIVFNQKAKICRTGGSFAFEANGIAGLAHVLTPSYGKLHVFDLGITISEPSKIAMTIDDDCFSGSHIDQCLPAVVIEGTLELQLSWLDCSEFGEKHQSKDVSKCKQWIQSDSVWADELVCVQQLVEIEPDSKWPLLTLVYMYEHDGLEKHAKEGLETLDKLSSIDSLRVNYYQDWRSRFIWAQHLASINVNSGTDRPFAIAPWRNNSLRDFNFASSLFLIETLVLDDNAIQFIPSDLRHLVRLCTLSLRRNQIKSADSAKAVKHLDSLRNLFLEGNPMPGCDIVTVQGWVSGTPSHSK
ncbi:geranylgeranyl transferase type-2 subunit alpha [Batrachochytrium salamandrivorans]|nr:geranylgeranyl transferase type-2 subunit alpha [Batrachochytrium salamandrivorans]